jgi:putative Mg2+ transporter-C (MgtC) family protein
MRPSNGQAVEFSFSPLLGIAIAAVLGGSVGIQRQAAAKPAGFRTHLLVATASAAFTAMGAHLHDTRIPSYVVVGIGFLGAGAITRQTTTAHGLTTAASIWMAAAIGLALGYSNSFGLSVGLLITAITIVALVLSDNDFLQMFRIRQKATVRVTTIVPRAAAQEITETFLAARARVESTRVLSLTNEGAEGVAELIYLLVLPSRADLNAVMRDVSALPYVRKVESTEPFFGA